MNLPTAHRKLSVAAIGGALLIAACILFVNRDFYHDDAFIVLRYASNVINGHGAVWNPGGDDELIFRYYQRRSNTSGNQK